MYRIEGTITRVKRERNHDIHIVLADVATPGAHMVVEADDPDFGKNVASPFRDRLAAARQMFDALVSESGGNGLDALRGTVVRVTGVGFFDFNHLQVGRSRSCIELHPILTIERMNAVSTEQADDGGEVMGFGSRQWTETMTWRPAPRLQSIGPKRDSRCCVVRPTRGEAVRNRQVPSADRRDDSWCPSTHRPHAALADRVVIPQPAPIRVLPKALTAKDHAMS